MVTVNVKISAPSLAAAQAAIRNLAERIEHPEDKLLARVGDAVLEDIDKRFMTRGYGTWAPLSPVTVKRKGHDNPLIDTGAMLSSTKYTILGGGKVRVEVPYGGKNHSPDVPGYHQEGTARIPQRKIVDKTPQLLNAISLTVATWVRDMVMAMRETL